MEGQAFLFLLLSVTFSTDEIGQSNLVDLNDRDETKYLNDRDEMKDLNDRDEMNAQLERSDLDEIN